ncbi:MAG: polysaccharide biosynthesis/export family protein [Candidatus Omnitrophica bacterium]|nr:polysaccharide biosynthesis/export family protein [Candidatus Omnitrophota bacterium]
MKQLILALCIFGMITAGYCQDAATLQDEARRYYQKGDALYAQGQYQEAQQEFGKALEILRKKKSLVNKVTPEIIREPKESEGNVTLEAVPQQKEALQEPAQESAVSVEEPLSDAAPETKEKSIPPPATTPVKKALEYSIGVDDVLFVSVWQNKELDQEVTVRPDGMIALPLLGDIPAAGLSLSALRENITRLLKEYIRMPSVLITVRKMGGARVIILGEVYSPGVYNVSKNCTVLEAIALSGGFTKDAVASSVIVIKGGFSNPKGIRLNLSSYLLKPLKPQNIALSPEDVIFIPKKFISNVNHFVNQIMEPIITGAYEADKLKNERW